MGINVECQSKVEPGEDYLSINDVRDWLGRLPNGATLHAISRDFGSQRDPDVRLVGLRATWSETKHHA